jgi:hypothetical protein
MQIKAKVNWKNKIKILTRIFQPGNEAPGQVVSTALTLQKFYVVKLFVIISSNSTYIAR